MFEHETDNAAAVFRQINTFYSSYCATAVQIIILKMP